MRQIEKNNNNSTHFLVFGRGPQTKSRVVASLRGAVPCSTSEVKQLRLLSGFSSCVYLVAAGPRFRALQMGSGLIRILGYLWLYILQRIILRVILLPCPLQVKWPFLAHQEPQFLFPREKIHQITFQELWHLNPGHKCYLWEKKCYPCGMSSTPDATHTKYSYCGSHSCLEFCLRSLGYD